MFNVHTCLVPQMLEYQLGNRTLAPPSEGITCVERFAYKKCQMPKCNIKT